MKLKNVALVAIALFNLIVSGAVYGQDDNRPLAFATAEGYGKYTVGGRGGTVYEVTNLNDSGKGSLREAVNAKGPRIVVFRVSGTIELKSAIKIKNPYITIAGQTAPGDGICIKDYPISLDADEIIIRYIRVRLGGDSGREDDAIGGRFKKNIILDHVSASWSVDETMSVYHCENVTIQWCIISESLFMSNHAKGNHGFGGIWGSNYSTYHHNLIAHHSSRNMRFSSGCGYNDYRNNVIYNWGYNSCYGGEKYQDADPNSEFNFTEINMVGNYYKPGPATQPGAVSYRIANPSFRSTEDYGHWYIAGNYVEGNEKVTADNWDGGVQADASMLPLMRRETPWEAMSIKEESPKDAYENVLAYAGCSSPVRDAVDLRIIEDVRSGSAKFEGPTYKTKKKVADKNVPCGIIDNPSDVGGWPELKSTEPPVDSDHDGIPDFWESANGLNPNNPLDASKIGDDGYTPLDKYLDAIIMKDNSSSPIISSDSYFVKEFYVLNGTKVNSEAKGVVIEMEKTGNHIISTKKIK